MDVARRARAAGRQVARRRRRQRGRRGALPAARDHPAVRPGATRGEWRQPRRFDAVTPTTTSRWPRRPVRTCGAEIRSNGLEPSRATPTTSASALDWAVETGSADHALRLVAPLTVTGIAIGDAAMDWAETASAIPGAGSQPALSHGGRVGLVGCHQRAATSRGPRSSLAAAEAAEDALGVRGPSVLRVRGSPRAVSRRRSRLSGYARNGSSRREALMGTTSHTH